MRNFVLAILLALSQSCSEDLDHRSIVRSSDVVVAPTTEFRIHLPDRSALETQNPSIKSLLNSYYIKLSPEGEECLSSDIFEDIGEYQDQAVITYALVTMCDYQIEFLLGHRAAEPTLSLTGDVTYDQILPIIETHCTSCHTEYSTYGGMFEDLDNIVFQIENGFMPPEEKLSSFEIASVLAWKSGGYLEEDPNPIPANSPLNLMRDIYYRNNYNSYVYSYLLKTQTFLIYEDVLWLQAEGTEINLNSVEYPITKPEQDTTTE